MYIHDWYGLSIVILVLVLSKIFLNRYLFITIFFWDIENIHLPLREQYTKVVK